MRRKSARTKFVECIDNALIRFILKKVAIYFTNMQILSRLEQIYVRAVIDILEREREYRPLLVETGFLAK